MRVLLPPKTRSHLQVRPLRAAVICQAISNVAATGVMACRPPLAWSAVPEGTQSLAVIMQHYPRGKVPGTDAPSQYWLLWNIPEDTTAIPRGNPTSIGDEGADKDERRTGYTPPCSPPGARHEYTITLYALNAAPDALPANDNQQVDWIEITQAIEPLIISSSSFTFWN